MNDSLNDIPVENWNCSSIPNEFVLVNWIKIILTINNSKSYVGQTTFFDGNVTLSNKCQTESRENKVISSAGRS